MPTNMTISRTGSFRYETTEPSKPCKGACVKSSVRRNQHIITSTATIYTATDRKKIDDGTCQIIYADDHAHSPSLHCNHSPEYDDLHGHLSYNNRTEMMDALKQRLPKEYAEILKQLKYDATQRNDDNLETKAYSLNKPSLKWTAYIKSLFNKISRKK